MKAYGYCRYSSDLQTEMSIKQQQNELNEYADKNNITIVKYYIDEAKSGTKDDRENFQLMINDCKKSQVDCILVWKTDRFARNTKDSLFYKMKLEKLGIKLISITQPIDNTTPEGNLMYTLLAGIDEYYSKNLASNIKRALKLNAQNALFNGGIAPLGYDIVDRKYVINEEESKIVKLIFDMYSNDKGITDIVNTLNQKGYKTKKGKQFGKNSIYNIITNERYTGNYIFNKGNKHNHNLDNNLIVVEDAIPPIIDKELFDKVNKMRNDNKYKNARHTAKNVYILSGLIYCGKCNSSYTGYTSYKTKNGKTYESSFYQCSHRNGINKCDNIRIDKKTIEQFAIDSIHKFICSNETIDTIVKNVQIEFNKLKQDNEQELIQIKNDITKTENEINNLIDIIAKTGNERLVKKLDELELVENDLKEKLAFTNITESITKEQIENIIKSDISKFNDTNKENLKTLAHKYIKKITIYETYFTLEFTFGEVRNLDLNHFAATILNYEYDISILKKE